MLSLRQIFAVLLAVACAAAGGCRVNRSEGNYVEHFQLDAVNISPEQEQKALAALHQWLPARGYKQLHDPADVLAATTWTGGVPFKEVWRNALDPGVPKSMFVVTVEERQKPEYLVIRLTSERWGDEADRERQLPTVERERQEFYKVFDDFPWLKKLDSRKMQPAGPVPAQ